ncbi:MAG: putative sulfate exporter family transporter [Rubrivivax sp.]|uniref:YeiH family protein n=1 Tax=Ottowia sp. TaxID=1898956 RepID=UPI00217A22D0|nr:putative sulfate exporter family transporter [Ottowia sp.]MCC6813977.1 putative sulfate exporter family transporter [Rubrivivax sp.]HNE59968.1 putative sulfate exporter family transporter [Ottowia sp.]HNR83224.1 putative sulfate exporter family transporter [Ottowia sp.]HNT85383.1 putative sulfate exporter family transporter [Ottowia sp.]
MSEISEAAAGVRGWPRQLRRLSPGLVVALIVALAATFVSEHYGGPKFLYALLMGMALHFLSEDARCGPGIEFAARQLVRLGVALLGARIAFGDVQALGGAGVAWLAAAVALTIGFGVALARALGLPARFGLISGGATGICGISAALAISSALPRDGRTEQQTLMTAIGVAALSTAAMVLYPLVAQALQLDARLAGLFLGGAIHDVAQVVGAGAILSPEVAQSATLVKMFRVAMLVPVVLCVALAFRAPAHAAGQPRPRGPALLPGFLLAFIALVVANSLGAIPVPLQSAAAGVSAWALVVAIAALGVKTSFEKIVRLGWRPIALLVSETLFIALFMLLAVGWQARS